MTPHLLFCVIFNRKSFQQAFIESLFSCFLHSTIGAGPLKQPFKFSIRVIILTPSKILSTAIYYYVGRFFIFFLTILYYII